MMGVDNWMVLEQEPRERHREHGETNYGLCDLCGMPLLTAIGGECERCGNVYCVQCWDDLEWECDCGEDDE